MSPRPNVNMNLLREHEPLPRRYKRMEPCRGSAIRMSESGLAQPRALRIPAVSFPLLAPVEASFLGRLPSTHDIGRAYTKRSRMQVQQSRHLQKRTTTTSYD